MVVWATGVNLEADDWPQWRGPERSDVSSETGLLRQWPDDGPRREWLFENAGRGYAGFSTAEGTLFTMGTREEQEILLALDAKTGRELWATPIGEVFVEERGDGPRGTPTVNGGNVYAMGSRGDLIAANASDGVALWRVSMLELGGKVPTWGYTESVLVDGERVICTPGGDQGAVVALDKRDGTVLWQSTEFTAPAQYASPIVFEFNGERQYAQLTMESLVGLSPEDGSLLWEKDWSGRTAVISTPIYHDGHIYVSSAYGAGCMLVRLKPDHEVEEVYANKVMKNHHGGVLRIDGYLYGYSDGAGWVCQDFLTGEEVWSSKKLGKGALSSADGMLYCLEEARGRVVLVEASPRGWTEVSRFELEPQSETRKPNGKIWTHPVISNGRLYLRDQELIFCFNVKR